MHCVGVRTKNLKEMQQRIEQIVNGKASELYLGGTKYISAATLVKLL